VTDPRTQLVGAGYDAMIDTWEEWVAQIVDDPRAEWCTELVARLPKGGRVLELGCGGGTAETKLLAERFRLTGVDLSAEQVSRARTRVPEAEFLQADLVEVEFEHGSIDAVSAFYSFNHVPRELLGDLFARIHSWLDAGGLFLAALGAGDTDGWIGEWLGTKMYFSSWPPETNRILLGQAGFQLLRDELVTTREPEGGATFHWVLATR
jgi:cyclopropane fatty-acyl-phospholipid synthase-like methyltransferase